MKTGLRAASGTVTALMDADGQHRPEDLEKLLDRFRSGGFDMVVGARSHEGHASHRRWAANGVFNRLASWMTNHQLERKDDLKRRIAEAARYVPLDQLCLSPQCGFSSTVHGINIAVEDQRNKIRLVVETAAEVWA